MSYHHTDTITPGQIRAARALLGWRQTDLAAASGVSSTAIAEFERAVRKPRVATMATLSAALREAGVEFIQPDGRRGAGVRLAAPKPDAAALGGGTVRPSVRYEEIGGGTFRIVERQQEIAGGAMRIAAHENTLHEGTLISPWLDERRRAAYHEAGHAVADYVLEHSNGEVTIAPDTEAGTLGSAAQVYGDDMTPEGMADLVVALFAGAEAESCVSPSDGPSAERVQARAASDDERAARYLPFLTESEEDLRARAAALVRKHWDAVDLIARELLAHTTLDGTEISTLVEIAVGEATLADLDLYRRAWGPQLAELPGRSG